MSSFDRDRKLLLIDLDDTMCNSSEAYKKAKIECFKFLKKEYPLLDRKTFMKAYKKARSQVHLELSGTASMHNRFLYFQRIFELLGLNLEPELLNEVTRLYWEETNRNLEVFEGVKETLRKVKQNNIKIGILTNLIAHVQVQKLRSLGITKHIDFIVSSEEAGREKPHPSPYLLALRKANCLPEEAIMVGNSLSSDIRGADRLGMDSVLFSKENKDFKENEPDQVIDDFREILEILDIEGKERKGGKIVVFDMMGTIFKEGHIISKMLVPLLHEKEIDKSYKEVKSAYVEYSKGEISQEEFRELVPKEIEKEFLDSMEINKEVLKIIKNWKSREVALGILSNIPKPWGDYLVDKFNLDEYFSTIVFSGQYQSRKPSEKLYRVFIEKSNYKPKNCYFIDDKLRNLEGVRHLLMKTVWLKGEDSDKLFIPDYKVGSLDELASLVGEI